MFHFGLQGNAFRQVLKRHLSGAGPTGDRKVSFDHLNKDNFLKSKMKHVVKCGVYLDILLMASIYLTTY